MLFTYPHKSIIYVLCAILQVFWNHMMSFCEEQAKLLFLENIDSDRYYCMRCLMSDSVQTDLFIELFYPARKTNQNHLCMYDWLFWVWSFQWIVYSSTQNRAESYVHEWIVVLSQIFSVNHLIRFTEPIWIIYPWTNCCFESNLFNELHDPEYKINLNSLFINELFGVRFFQWIFCSNTHNWSELFVYEWIVVWSQIFSINHFVTVAYMKLIWIICSWMNCSFGLIFIY